MVVRVMADGCGINLPMALAAKIRERHCLPETETTELGPKVIHQDVSAGLGHHGQTLANVQHRHSELTLFQRLSALKKTNAP